MKYIEQERPKVFISYSRTLPQLEQWVENISTRLVEEYGIEVILDQWDLKLGHDMYHFMEESVRRANKVLVICDRTYEEKADSRIRGVGTETQIITPEVYRNTIQEKFIPIAYEKKEDNSFYFPRYLRSRIGIDLSNEKTFEHEFMKLVDNIYDIERRPKLGPIPNFVQSFPQKTTDIKKKLIDDEKAERIVWFLPRGFFLMRNVTYRSDPQWTVDALYITYEGDTLSWIQYHPQLEEQWIRNGFESLLKSLYIPKADWYCQECRAGLDFLKSIRRADPDVRLKFDVQKCDGGYYAEYFSPLEKIYLPDVRDGLKVLYETRKLRDIKLQIIEKRNQKVGWKMLPKDLLLFSDTLKLELDTAALEYFGDDCLSYKHLMEVVRDHNSSFSMGRTQEWLERVENILGKLITADVYGLK